MQAIINGFKRAIGTDYLALLSFDDFARHYQWFVKTLQVIAASHPLSYAAILARRGSCTCVSAQMPD